jgi:uncharacterized Zn-finger protein
MRIIEPGVIKSKTRIMTCEYCDCKFEYEREDIHVDQRDGDRVRCPFCGEFINVKTV